MIHVPTGVCSLCCPKDTGCRVGLSVIPRKFPANTGPWVLNSFGRNSKEHNYPDSHDYIASQVTSPQPSNYSSFKGVLLGSLKHPQSPQATDQPGQAMRSAGWLWAPAAPIPAANHRPQWSLETQLTPNNYQNTQLPLSRDQSVLTPENIGVLWSSPKDVSPHGKPPCVLSHWIGRPATWAVKPHYPRHAPQGFQAWPRKA